MHRVPVVLQATVAEYADRNISLQTNLLAQDISDELRAMLGANGEAIPDADSTLAWYAVPTEIVLVARRNGSMTARAGASTGDTTATALLMRAYAGARKRDGAKMFFPSDTPADSILVRVSLWPAYVGGGAMRTSPFEDAMQFATFFHMEPERTPATPLPNQRVLVYPGDYVMTRAYAGVVLIQFAIDSTGRTNASSIRDLWPADKLRPGGEGSDAYEAFVRSVRAWQVNRRYSPAHLGPCAVKHWMWLPVVFDVNRRRP